VRPISPAPASSPAPAPRPAAAASTTSGLDLHRADDELAQRRLAFPDHLWTQFRSAITHPILAEPGSANTSGPKLSAWPTWWASSWFSLAPTNGEVSAKALEERLEPVLREEQAVIEDQQPRRLVVVEHMQHAVL